MSIWTNLKQRARTTGYLFNGKGNIERYFLEATCNDQSIPCITEHQKITAARLSYEKHLFIPVKNVIVERLSCPSELISIKKTLLLIDFILKKGNDIRSEIIEMQPLLESVSCSRIYKNHKNSSFRQAEIENKIISQKIIILINDEDEYLNERNQTKEEQQIISNIELNPKFTSPKNNVKRSPKQREMKERVCKIDNADFDSKINETSDVQINETSKSNSVLEAQDLREIDGEEEDDDEVILFDICENEKKNIYPSTPQPKSKNFSFGMKKKEEFGNFCPLTPNTKRYDKKTEKIKKEFGLLH